MVVDGGGHFISPAGIDSVHTLSLFLLSHTAHDHAEDNPHTQTLTTITTERGYSTSLDRGV